MTWTAFWKVLPWFLAWLALGLVVGFVAAKWHLMKLGWNIPDPGSSWWRRPVAAVGIAMGFGVCAHPDAPLLRRPHRDDVPIEPAGEFWPDSTITPEVLAQAVEENRKMSAGLSRDLDRSLMGMQAKSRDSSVVDRLIEETRTRREP